LSHVPFIPIAKNSFLVDLPTGMRS